MRRNVIIVMVGLFAAFSFCMAGCGGGGGGSSDQGTINHAPVANAGNDQYVELSAVVKLNGTNSSDTDNNMLKYTWVFDSKPAGSSATISSPSSATPTFIADAVGIYMVSLVVNDGIVNSTNTSKVSITAISTNSFQYPFKIANWNVRHGDNIYGKNGCSIYNDPVEKIVDNRIYLIGFAAYTGSGLLNPVPGTYNTIIDIIPYYSWVGNRTLGSGAFSETTWFLVDNGAFYFFKWDLS